VIETENSSKLISEMSFSEDGTGFLHIEGDKLKIHSLQDEKAVLILSAFTENLLSSDSNKANTKKNNTASSSMTLLPSINSENLDFFLVSDTSVSYLRLN